MVQVVTTLLAVMAATAMEPAADAEVTVWARSGARSYITCASEDEAARLAAGRWQGRAQELPDDHQWAQRADDCPHAPDVLRVAALYELSRSFALPPRIDEADLSPVAKTFETSRRRALTWLQASMRERTRRGLPAPDQARFFIAVAHLGLDDAARALDMLDAAHLAGEVDRYEMARVAALAHLLDGDLDAALRRAHEAVVHAPGRSELAAMYVYALVLDRAGEPSTAASILRRVRTRDRDSAELYGLLAWLPLHERLYLMALDRQANASVPNEALRLWAAYLQLEAPSPGERTLAERHRAQLLPTPGHI